MIKSLNKSVDISKGIKATDINASAGFCPIDFIGNCTLLVCGSFIRCTILGRQ